ncbi:hypothetical protein BC628DRAFT_478417 [Trametes gibbosa]|nr:hypothetical protein BC628DRAFT_478417 [Trametes gibbosa]
MQPTIALFPAELLILVGKHVDPNTLPSLLLVNRQLNELLTDTLYSHIKLETYEETKHCLSTLSTASRMASPRGCDIQSMVRSLYIDNFEMHSPVGSEERILESLQNSLERSLPRLVNLQVLSVQLPALLLEKPLVYTVVSLARTLISVDAVLSPPGEEFSAHLEPVAEDTIRPASCLHLTKFRTDGLSPLHTAFFKSLLAYRANDLTELCLSSCIPETVCHVLGSATFPALQVLELDNTAFFHPQFPHDKFPLLSTLSFKICLGWAREPSDFAPFPSTAYPKLEKLSCEERDLPYFLPVDVGVSARRPIHTITLDNAMYPWGSGACFMPPSEVEAALQHLPFSGVPVKHLSFHIADLYNETLSNLAPLFKSLESLLIVYSYDPYDELDSETVWDMIANMPQLHTLLFSESPIRPDDYYGYEADPCSILKDLELQREAVYRWGKISGTLRRVAFTSETQWMREGDGWSMVTNV